MRKLPKENNKDYNSVAKTPIQKVQPLDYFEEEKDEYGLTSWDHTHELLLLIFCILLLVGIFAKVVFL